MPLLRPRRARSVAAFVALATAALAAPVVTPAPAAQAADTTPFFVVGTSDVFDSHLLQDVLKPGFEALYPQYDLQYTSKGTGAALTSARTGDFDAAIVHAASVENQFVAQGYSAEPYGRAVFWGDFILAGPANDPAGVLDGASQDIATAFEKIAAAGANGQADFISRGGTPGTSVQEHAIWAVTQGVRLCSVPSVNGGGKQPTTDGGPDTCATDFNTIPLPAWYHQTNANQGANVKAADTCTGVAGVVSNSCYVFTDRGTFNYLEAKAPPEGLRTDDRRLRILTRGSNVPGEENLLINSFHAYAVNPAKFADNPNVEINSDAATKFLDWMTSPAGQAAVGAYLDDSGDPPFIPSAAPIVTTNPLATSVRAGQSVQVLGSLTNETPGTPVLDAVRVNLLARPIGSSASPAQVGTTLTDADGRFSFSYRPSRGLSYSLATAQITKIEVPTLSPPFGDLLAPTHTELGAVPVQSVLSGLRVGKLTGFRIRTRGTVAPAVVGSGARVALYAAKPGKALTFKGTRSLKSGASSYDLTYKLGKGTWSYELRFLNPGIVLPTVSVRKTVTLTR